MANGPKFNVAAIGQIASEPKLREGGKNRYLDVELAEWPPTNDQYHRGLVRISLKLKPDQRAPERGAVIHVASGVYQRRPGKNAAGEEMYFHDLTAFVWTVLPVGKPATANSPAPKPASAEQPSAATPPPAALDDEDEDVPF